MIIDFRRGPLPIADLVIDGKAVDRVTEYKYLGTIIDNTLKFDCNTRATNKKCQSRMYCLQKLRSLNVNPVNPSILAQFYRCFIESVLTFGFLCWFGGLSVKDKSVLNRVVNVCGKVVGEKQVRLCELYERRVERKGREIAKDTSYVLA